jgi:hypothetical protein
MGKYELIAISRVSVRTDDPDCHTFSEWEHFNSRPEVGELYEFYNVLWIEWEDGIAYREGLGRILKLMWEKHSSEVIDVTLG